MPDYHHTSLRLPGYDYRSQGAFFITICIHRRQHLLGRVRDTHLLPSDAGMAVEQIWRDLPTRFDGVEAGEFIAMPNHIHGILTFSGETVQKPLSAVIAAYKSLTTHAYIVGVRRLGWPAFSEHFWQPNYYEHVIRTERAQVRIIEYIRRNPAMWDRDPENP